MRLLFLTALTMIAFAGNSILNRLAVGSGSIAPIDFAMLRLVAGAATLGALLSITRKLRWTGWTGKTLPVSGLLAYLIGFSVAYLQLDAGSGALILFGVVQITMFAGALLAKDPMPLRRWLGAALAFCGLFVMLWPAQGTTLALAPAFWMIFAGLGWGVYSLAGTREPDPTLATGWNFMLALIPGLTLMVWFLDLTTATAMGVSLALISGAVTSGLGYALWYRVLPALGPGRAAIAQLTVPVIAAAAGVLFLSEPVGLRFVLAAILVFAGVAFASRGNPK